jgi:hypothetical protein
MPLNHVRVHGEGTMCLEAKKLVCDGKIGVCNDTAARS